MNTKVIETVSFKLAEGVEDADFIKTTDAVSSYLQSCKGFNTRRLSKADDNTWLEHIEWDNMDDAKAASASFMDQESIVPYMQSIDPETVSMSHQDLLVKAG